MTTKHAEQTQGDIEKWRATVDREGTPLRSGTGCKCGAHTSVTWPHGGEDWLVAHVLEVHPMAFDWPAAIRRALTLKGKEALEELRALVGAPETTEKD